MLFYSRNSLQVCEIPSFLTQNSALSLYNPFLMNANSMASFCFAIDLNKNGADGFSAGLIDDDNLFKWELMIVGPPDTF